MERDPLEMAMSTDIVMDNVLSHLKVKDLLACRKVSKFWNKAASSVLRRRSTMIKNISREMTLRELGECVKQSSDFPFAGLKLDEPWKFRTVGAMKFFMNYGARFTSLFLGTSSEKRLAQIAPFLHHLPRLSTLEVGWSSRHAHLLGSAAVQEDGGIPNLPSLRTFRISNDLNDDILRKVFKAASPSLRIECLWSSYEILEALKDAGKLQAVAVLNVNEDVLGRRRSGEDFSLRVATLLSTESPSLTKLDFNVKSFLSLDGFKKLLISSQHTLKYLGLVGVCPAEFLSECPVLAKLTTLSLCIKHPYEYVFQGRQGHKFPALKELKLDVADEDCNTSIGDLSDGLFIVPSLTTINLIGLVGKAGIEDLARSFPNVIEIRLKQRHYDFDWYQGSDPFYIWSVGAFKTLEKLVIWDYTVKRPTKNYVNMDRFLTGMPMKICEKLRKHKQQNLIDSPFNDILRHSPSILQVQNLKELIVCVKFENGLEELPEEPPFISMVSVWYALHMMPNLEAKFVYECNSPSWRFKEEKRVKAVTMLKAAFKHVQPYIKLEPFFY